MDPAQLAERPLGPPQVINWDSQSFVSLATAMIPIGWCGMSARSTLVSPPVYLLARSTARRAQSDQ